MMPTRCCVPGCSESGDHNFPSDPELHMKWRVAIKRTSRKTRALWTPGKHDVVCHQHFTENDYKDTLLGKGVSLVLFKILKIYLIHN